MDFAAWQKIFIFRKTATESPNSSNFVLLLSLHISLIVRVVISASRIVKERSQQTFRLPIVPGIIRFFPLFPPLDSGEKIVISMRLGRLLMFRCNVSGEWQLAQGNDTSRPNPSPFLSPGPPSGIFVGVASWPVAGTWLSLQRHRPRGDGGFGTRAEGVSGRE